MGRSATEDDIRRIYRETIDALYGFVSRRCDGDRDLAEDVTQETWLRAVRAWRADGVPERPLAWLSTVAARLLSNHRRRPAAERLDDGAGDTLPAADDGASLDRSERRSLVERAMARLPALQHRLLEAFHYDRRPVAEIASAFGLSERGVEGRLRRARQRLRRIIESDPDTKERMQ
jgi:RNA polymerase sigma-70 factor (ECF subfamily)